MSEKTEEATDSKLKESRLKGDLPKSSDFTIAFSSLLWFLALSYLVIEALALGVKWLFYFLQTLAHADNSQVQQKLANDIIVMLLVGLAIPLALALLFVLIPEVLQTRGNLAVKRTFFDPQRVNPVSGFKQLFSLQRFTSIAFALLRFVIIAWIMFNSVRGLLAVLPFLWQRNWMQQFSMLGDLLIGLYGWVALCCFALAAVDVFLQIRLWKRRNKMSKQDVRQEHRNQEGDPHMKGARQGLQQELASGN